MLVIYYRWNLHKFTPQISRPYSRIVRSLENLPMPATFRIDMRRPRLLVAIGVADPLLAGDVGGVVGQHQEVVAPVEQGVDERAEQSGRSPGEGAVPDQVQRPRATRGGRGNRTRGS